MEPFQPAPAEVIDNAVGERSGESPPIYPEHLQQIRDLLPAESDIPETLLHESHIAEIAQIRSGIKQGDPVIEEHLQSISKFLITQEEFTEMEQLIATVPSVQDHLSQRLSMILADTREFLEAPPLLVANVGSLRQERVLLGPASHMAQLRRVGSFRHTTTSPPRGGLTAYATAPEDTEDTLPEVYFIWDKPIPLNESHSQPSRVQTATKVDLDQRRRPKTSKNVGLSELFVSLNGTVYWQKDRGHREGDALFITTEQSLLTRTPGVIVDGDADSIYYGTPTSGENTHISPCQEPTVIVTSLKGVDHLRRGIARSIDPASFFETRAQNIYQKADIELARLQENIARYDDLLSHLDQLSGFNLERDLSKEVQQISTAVRASVDILRIFYELNARDWTDLTFEEIDGATYEFENATRGELYLPGHGGNRVEQLANRLREHMQDDDFRTTSGIPDSFLYAFERSASGGLPVPLFDEFRILVAFRDHLRYLDQLTERYLDGQILDSPFAAWQNAVGEEGQFIDRWIEDHVIVTEEAWGTAPAGNGPLKPELKERILEKLRKQASGTGIPTGVLIKRSKRRTFISRSQPISHIL